VPELYREHAMRATTFYQWRAKYEGLGASLMVRLRALADENHRLKNMCAE
jgi:putative transposase